MVNIATYNPSISSVHAIDARVKIILVVVFSITLFCIHSWWAIGVLTLCAAGALACAGVRVGHAIRALIPVVFILLVTLIANSFVLDVGAYNAQAMPGAVSAGIFEQFAPIALIGSFGFVPAGFARGCYYALRIVLLLAASLVLTTTTTSTEITQALRSFLRPLEKLGLPVHDAATVVSIALRFIPVTIDEFQKIRLSHTARGVNFNTGGLLARIRAWASVLIPLFVGLYRRADNLALAMDTRCYGSASATTLVQHVLSFSHALLLIAGTVLCVGIAIVG